MGQKQKWYEVVGLLFCFVAATAALEKTDFFDDNFLIPPSRIECESTPSDPPARRLGVSGTA